MAQTTLRTPPVFLATFPTTSGTFVDFNGIPSWARKITISLNGISSNASSHIIAQIGTASGLLVTGYTSFFANMGSAGTSSASITNGFGIWSANAADITSGIIVLTNMGNNLWAYSCSGGLTNGAQNYGTVGGGYVTLSDILTRLRLTTTGGTAIFDAGSVSVMCE